jgi:hypothetical protein
MNAILIGPEAGIFPVNIGKPTDISAGFFTVRWSLNLQSDFSLLPLAWTGADGEFDSANHWSIPPDTFRHSRYPFVIVYLSPILPHKEPSLLAFVATVVVVVELAIVVVVVELAIVVVVVELAIVVVVVELDEGFGATVHCRVLRTFLQTSFVFLTVVVNPTLAHVPPTVAACATGVSEVATTSVSANANEIRDTNRILKMLPSKPTHDDIRSVCVGSLHC